MPTLSQEELKTVITEARGPAVSIFLPTHRAGPDIQQDPIRLLSWLAFVVDYHVVPKRFTPGFEWVFTRAWFPVLYAGLAGSLWAGGQVSARLPIGAAGHRLL